MAVIAAAQKMASVGSTLLRMGHLKHSVFRQCSLNVRRICVPVTTENKSDNSLKEKRKEKRRKRREEGIRIHAMYHMEVNELATELRLKRLEEEKHLNTEQQEKENLRKLEKTMHDRVIESVHLENKSLELQR